MDDYISRQTAIDALEGEISVTGRANAEAVLGYANLICDRIKRLPSEDVVPVRHGRWIPKFDGKFQGGAYWFDCSECGHTVTGGNLSGKHFCENCGARMDGEQDG